ncbi:MAG: S8 family serine peptidase, partial [Pseudoxanthomonas sp.]
MCSCCGARQCLILCSIPAAGPHTRPATHPGGDPARAAPATPGTAAGAPARARDGAYLTMSGTSMATPHVAGAAAIVK